MPTDPPLPRYSWEQTFCDAILETDNSVLAGRLENARRALADRHTAISDIPEHRKELRAIQQALRGLQVLEHERLASTPYVPASDDPDPFSDLCRQAATEKDPEKLTAVIAEINTFLRNKDAAKAEEG
jgi:hypothetical protein